MDIKMEDILLGIVRAGQDSSMFVAGIRGEKDFASAVQVLERACREVPAIRDLVIYSIVPVLHNDQKAMDRYTQAELAYLDSVSEQRQAGPSTGNKFKS
ncbi:MAG: hypothetical protein IJK73_01110 [Bacteroidales bacterium]|nr:hypothetical protein [Bacteroidales bacterium]